LFELSCNRIITTQSWY